MDTFVENLTLYRITIASIALFSLFICKKLNSQRITAERAFWGIWIFLVVSAEIVTNFDFFEYPYPIDTITRIYTLQLFLASAIGFILATFFVFISKKKIRTKMDISEILDNWKALTDKRKLYISIVFFAVGIAEFLINYIRYGNLLDLRLGSIEETHIGFQGYTYFFYFAHSFLLLLGYIDGNLRKISKIPVFLAIAGLIFHNLSVGGRINIVLGPLFYIISYMLCFNTNLKDDREEYYRARRYFLIFIGYFFIIFSIIGLLRSWVVDFSSISTVEGFFNKVFFAVPKYISDAYVSISVHAGHALSVEPQFGKFTFDALYRILDKIDVVETIKPDLFGHILYRHTPAPWAWTQTNVIPRLIADFGEFFWVMVSFFIAFFTQWISIYLSKRDFIKHSVVTMVVICTIYTIQAAMWFSAFTVIILFFCILIDRSLKVKSVQKKITHIELYNIDNFTNK